MGMKGPIKPQLSTARSGFVILPQRKLNSRMHALLLEHKVHKGSTAERCTENPVGGVKNDDSMPWMKSS